MSGGSWNYFYRQIEKIAEDLFNSKCPYRSALGVHMQLIAQAMHDIEWVDSSDYLLGNEIEAIKKVLKPEDILEKSINDAKKMVDQLNELIKECKKIKGKK